MTAPLMTSAVQGSKPDDRTRLQDAIVEALSPLYRNNGGYLQTLSPYGWELNSNDDIDEILTRLRGRSPAIFVAIGNASFERKSANSRTYLADYTVELLCMSAHRGRDTGRTRGDESAIHDPTLDPGIWKILHDVRELLLHRSFPVCGAILPQPVSEEASTIQTKDLSAWISIWEFSMWITAPDRSNPGRPAESVLHRHRLPGAPNVVVAEGLCEK